MRAVRPNPIRRCAVLLAGTAAIAVPLISQSLETSPLSASTSTIAAAPPAAVAQLSAEVAAQVDALFAPFTQPGSPGCALGIAHHGAVVHARGYGLASLEHAVPITAQTVFDLGSTSKQMTAALVLLLVAEGKLSLDESVRERIPELPALYAPVTLRHLLHHTAGIRDYIVLLELAGVNGEDRATAAETLAMLARQRNLDFAPGSDHAYSNSGYFLLAMAAERASGRPLRELAEQRLFAPLAMRDSQVLDDTSRVVPRRADSYASREDGGYARVTSRWEQTGDGAVQSTVEDLLRWAANFAKPTVGGAALVAALEQPGALADGRPLDYARGLMVRPWRGARLIAHGGAWMGFRAELLRLPEHGLAVAVLCNVADADPTALGLQVATLVLGDALAPEPVLPADAGATPPPSAEAARRAGLYWSPASNLVRRLEARDGRLFYLRDPGAETALRPLAPGRFAMVGVPVSTEVVFADEPDRAHDFTVRTAGVPPMPFQRVEPAALTPARLAELAGDYSSDELDTRWRLVVEDGALVARTRREVSRPLAAVFADAFRTPDGALLRVARDAGGRPTGFTVSAGRARDIRFTRDP